MEVVDTLSVLSGCLAAEKFRVIAGESELRGVQGVQCNATLAAARE